MARPEGQPQSPAGSAASGEAPSAAAELHIIKIPVSSSPDALGEPDAGGTGDPASRLATMLRRAGFGVHARMLVPAADAREMLTTIRSVGLAATWAGTVLVTLAITVPADIPVAVIIIILAIELIGFVIGALSLRRRRRTG
jgi:hypothetical protein